MKTKFLILWTGVLLFTCLWGCEDPKEYSYDNVIFVDQSSVALFYGDTVRIIASPTQEGFEWSSEDPTIATVNAEGLIEAVGVGETSIIVLRGSVRQLISVKVTIPTLSGVIGRAGKRRAHLDLDIQSDKIKTVRIFRTDNEESIDFDINYQRGIVRSSYDDLAEGQYTFRLVCLDKFDNISLPIEVSVNVYGDDYQNQLQSREILAATQFGNGLVIRWADSQGSFCDLFYTDTNGNATSKTISVTSEPTYLFDFGSGLSYTTLYLPEPMAVDTFNTGNREFTYTRKAPILTSDAACEIFARDFDLGGEGVGFHDNGPGNSAGNYGYREDLGDMNSRDVDVENGLNLGYTDPGEWLMYTVNVRDAGSYTVDLNISVSESAGAKYHLEMDGSPTPVFDLITNYDWSDWRWYYERNSSTPSPEFNLTQGTHKIKFYFETGGFNFMSLKFTYKKD